MLAGDSTLSQTRIRVPAAPSPWRGVFSPATPGIELSQSLLFLGGRGQISGDSWGFVDRGDTGRPIAGHIADSGFRVNEAFRDQDAKQHAMRIRPFVKGAENG